MFQHPYQRFFSNLSMNMKKLGIFHPKYFIDHLLNKHSYKKKLFFMKKISHATVKSEITFITDYKLISFSNINFKISVLKISHSMVKPCLKLNITHYSLEISSDLIINSCGMILTETQSLTFLLIPTLKV